MGFGRRSATCSCTLPLGLLAASCCSHVHTPSFLYNATRNATAVLQRETCRGTDNNAAIQKLLHFAVSDVSDDVRRAAVLCLGFVLMNVPQQCPRIVALLAESYNPHVRQVVACVRMRARPPGGAAGLKPTSPAFARGRGVRSAWGIAAVAARAACGCALPPLPPLRASMAALAHASAAPCLLALLCRYGAAMAVGMACAGTGLKVRAPAAFGGLQSRALHRASGCLLHATVALHSAAWHQQDRHARLATG